MSVDSLKSSFGNYFLAVPLPPFHNGTIFSYSSNLPNSFATARGINRIIFYPLLCSDMSADGDSMSSAPLAARVKKISKRVRLASSLVKYCNATRQKAHRPQYKKECRKRAAELHDEALFKQPPPRDECDICTLPLPTNAVEISYQTCCGKSICIGCSHGVGKGNKRCPFCRAPWASEGELLQRYKKRAEAGDATAISQLGYFHCAGWMGLKPDHDKAIELWLRAGKLGFTAAYSNIASAYHRGNGVERDEKKAKYYAELAAMGGDVKARHNIGIDEANAGNMNRAVKHWMIAAGTGYDKSLENIRKCFMKGHATKGDFEKALRAHKDAKDAMTSDQREAARGDKQFMGQFATVN